MTRMQIIAKAVLSALGLHVAVRLWDATEHVLALSLDPARPVPIAASAACLTAIAVVFAATAVWLVFNNDRIARWLAGDGQVLQPAEQKRSLVVSYRLVLLVVGLVWLPGAIATLGGLLLQLWPPNLRDAFTRLIDSGFLPSDVDRPLTHWFRVITESLDAMLAGYLILGAPHFVRWQLNHSVGQQTLDLHSGSNAHEP